MQLHDILEEHAEYICTNPDCKKNRQEENLISEFDGPNHYVMWVCEKCGQYQWWKTKELSSGIKHTRT